MFDLSKLEKFLDDSAAVFALGQLVHVTKNLISKGCSLLDTSEFNEFLDDVVTKNVINELLRMRQHLEKDEVLEWLLLETFLGHLIIGEHVRISHLTGLVMSIVKCLLNIPTSMLVYSTLKYMPSQNSVINYFILCQHFNQVLEKL